MTEINVHFLILKNTKKFANLWWLNLGTDSDLSTALISYCGQFDIVVALLEYMTEITLIRQYLQQITFV